MVSFGVSRSTRVSWKWSRKLPQRCAKIIITFTHKYLSLFTLSLTLMAVHFIWFTRSHVHRCPAFTAKCAHDLPPSSQIPHRLLAYYPDPVLSQYQSSTHRCRKQPKHPYPQVKFSTDPSLSFLLSVSENIIQ